MDDNSCGDGGCKLRVGPRVGQHTNGGCRCLQDLQTKDRIRVGRKLHELNSRLAAWEAWGAAVKRCFPDIVDECCIPEMDALFADMPEVDKLTSTTAELREEK